MTTSLATDLNHIVGENKVSIAQSVLKAHACDESFHLEMLPDAVVFAETREDIQAVLRYATREKIPIVPFTAGTSLEGHALPRFGGISLNTSRMDKILALRPNDLLAVVQPGVLYPKLNAVARGHGLFMPVDPGAEASIGGMTATNASGTNAVRYGTMREMVLALEVVLSDGTVIRTGTQARKSSSGYDLTRLFIGSEGTLGVFSEITIKLIGLPNAILAASATFPDVTSAVSGAVAMIQAGIAIAKLELMDTAAIRAVNQHKGLTLTELPTLFLEFHGGVAGISEDAQLAQELCEGFGAEGFTQSLEPEQRKILWEARHQALWSLKAMNPNKAIISTDAAVPISALPDAVAHAEQQVAAAGLDAGIVGHVGDGNFHVFIVADPNDIERWTAAELVNHRIVEYAIKCGGTATGEHGVGIRKREFMQLEHGAGLEVMRSLKKTLDPLGILNPGKLIDTVDSWQNTK